MKCLRPSQDNSFGVLTSLTRLDLRAKIDDPVVGNVYGHVLQQFTG